MNEKRAKIAVLLLLAFVSVIGINIWAAGLDIERNRAAIAYEQCVQKEYGMTPIQWYEKNHKYPLCGN